MSSAPGWWLYYRLIPSALSATLALIMIVYIFLTQSKTRKERRYYIHLSVFYGVADIVQSMSWFIGPKFDMSYEVCSVQEYLFEFGSMCKAMTMMIISWGIFYIIKRMKPFNLMDPEIRKYIVGLWMYAVFSLIMCICFRTSNLFCNEDNEASIAHGSTEQRGVFLLVYVVPIYIMYACNLVTTAVTFKYIMKLDTEITATSSLLRPLLPYPLIFTAALVPAGINIGLHMTTARHYQAFENISGLGIACCGIFYVTAFFYFQYVEWKKHKARELQSTVDLLLTSSEYTEDVLRAEAKLLREGAISSDAALYTLPLESEASSGDYHNSGPGLSEF